MNRSTFGLIAPALALSMLMASTARASCPASDIIGTWDDEFGSVATITSETKGTATASSLVCAASGTIYKLTIKLNGKNPPTAAKVVGVAPKSSGCPKVVAQLKYNSGTCTVASGPVKFDGQSIEDTWTKQANAKVKPRKIDSSLTQGLK